VPNWCWHEYGNRVGFWRLLEILDAAGCACGLAINGRAVETCPEISQAALDRGWEFMGHCWLQRSLQRAPDEREEIRLTTEAIARFTGKPPRGWLGAALAETWTTPERLVEAGYDYVCDWVVDDVPLRLRTRNGSIASVPYSQEVNDVPMILQQQHPAREWRDRAIDQFEQLRQDAREAPRVLALVVHPYIMGAPHRARYVREALAHINASGDVAWMTGGAILDHWGV
jgi:peptidoglycan/xylan/chitin deacetylase (PgdA/CDA1 family)